MSESSIAIGGGGIAGLAAALLLAKAGRNIVVHERAAAFSEVGAGLQLSPNAGRILDSLGLGPALDAAAIRPVAIEMRAAASGRLIVSLPLERAALRYGAPYRLLHRAELLAVLLEAVAADPRITVRTAAPLAAVEADGDGVRFLSAGTAERADLLIGADGVRSAIRVHLGGKAARPTGRTAWRTTIAAEMAPRPLPRDRVTVFLGERTHVVVYPVSAGRAINVVTILEEDWRDEGWNAPGDADALAARFSGAADSLLALIAAAREGSGWTRWCLCDVDARGPWQRGRIALVGDAAHAMLPFLAQGAAMAIEDAAILARFIAKPDLPADIALQRYVAHRRPRAARVAEAARRSGALYHLGSLAAPLRDAAMRALGGDRLLQRYDWLYGWTAAD